MEEKIFPESGFRILNIILLESNFKREINVSFEPDKRTTEADINFSHEIKENQVLVTLSLSFNLIYEGKTEISSFIKILGVFEKSGDSQVQVDTFAKINGPAILFPFVREQLASLSLKAGVGAIIIPPLNFVKKSEELKK